MAEYTEYGAQTVPQWSKSYVYLGGRLLSTLTAGSYGEVVQYHHPDRLGTRLVTNAADTSSFEQATLPYGTALGAESSGATNRRFTSYDRSNVTGLDYAVNRHYDPMQGRFTQVDPIGMRAASLGDPQSLNLYAYCGNDPVNRLDPSGLFFGKLFRWLGRALKWIAIAAAVAAVVVTIFVAPPSGLLHGTLLGKILGFIAGIPNAIGGFVAGVGKTIAGVFTLVEKGVSIGVAIAIGNAVLLGGSAAAGAISKHFQTKEKFEKRKQQRRRKEIETFKILFPTIPIIEAIGDLTKPLNPSSAADIEKRKKFDACAKPFHETYALETTGISEDTSLLGGIGVTGSMALGALLGGGLPGAMVGGAGAASAATTSGVVQLRRARIKRDQDIQRNCGRQPF